MEDLISKGKSAMEPFTSKMPIAYDITSRTHHALSFEAAEALITALETTANIQSFENQIFPELKNLPVGLHLAIKLALSKSTMKTLPPFHLTVLFAMYNEHNRLKTKEEHDAGEDFLRQKVKEMNWLFGLSNDHTWDIVAIDDGCPNNSGKLCEAIIEKDTLPRTRVVYLQDAIDQADPDFSDIQNTKDSQKGGSIHYGFKKALTEYPKSKKHIALYTDADLSANMGLSALLASPILTQGKSVSIGDRYVDLANYATDKGGFSLVLQEVVHAAVRVWIRSSILPPLKGIVDTQCGFKAIDVEALAKVYPLLKDRKFSFDMEFLIKTAQTIENPFGIVPIVWVESMAESNFYATESSFEVSAQSYFKMIKNMCGLSDKMFAGDDKVNKEVLEYFKTAEFPEYFKMTQAMMPEVHTMTIGGLNTTLEKLKSYLTSS